MNKHIFITKSNSNSNESFIQPPKYVSLMNKLCLTGCFVVQINETNLDADAFREDKSQ